MNLISIVYENNEILIINKPAGLSVQGGMGVVNSVDTLLPKQTGNKCYLVHRLDKDTAGLLLTAKNASSASKWTKLMGSRQVKKEYTALCLGDFFGAEGLIQKPIAYKQGVKDALSRFSVQKTGTIGFNELTYVLSLVHLELITGRMHQLRIHLASEGLPILADGKYGDFKINKVLSKNWGIKKLHLASTALSLPAETGIRRIEIELPDHIKQTLKFFNPPFQSAY